MPYSTCPTCGQAVQLLVTGELPEWYAEHARGKQIGDDVSLEGFTCWKISQKTEAASKTGKSSCQNLDIP